MAARSNGMSEAAFARRLDQLIGYFNRHVLDVPDGLIDRNATFSLNGVSYESMLGRSSDDPLVRLITRGPAGYRFVAKSVTHALDGANARGIELDVTANRASGGFVLGGTLRGSGDTFEERLSVDMTLTPAGALASVDVTLSEEAVARVRRAREM